MQSKTQKNIADEHCACVSNKIINTFLWVWAIKLPTVPVTV